jgi:MoxR-like ATPase
VPFPSTEELAEILNRTTGSLIPEVRQAASGADIIAMRNLSRDIPIALHVNEFVADLIVATHPNSPNATPLVKKYVRYGSSPRGGQALILGAKVTALLDERYNVAFEDVSAVAAAALRHRLLLNFEGLAEGVRTDAVIQELLEASHAFRRNDAA